MPSGVGVDGERKKKTMKFDKLSFKGKVQYVRGRLTAAGYRLMSDKGVSYLFHVLDKDGNDLTGPKVIDAILEWFLQKGD